LAPFIGKGSCFEMQSESDSIDSLNSSTLLLEKVNLRHGWRGQEIIHVAMMWDIAVGGHSA
jgi:hypothetical protein